MEAKILNFVDALRLSKLLASSGVKEVEVSPAGLEYLMGKMSPRIFLEILQLISGKSTKELSKLTGKDTVKLLAFGLVKNRINELLVISLNSGGNNVV